MNIDEARQLYRALFTAFPSFKDYLDRLEDGEATYRVWCEMLAKVEYDHGVEVVALLKSGDRKLPEAYDRDRLPLLLRSYAQRIADDRAKAEANEKLQQESQRRRVIRSDSPWRHNLGSILNDARESGRRLRDGEITEAENARIVDELRTKARETKSSAREVAQ